MDEKKKREKKLSTETGNYCRHGVLSTYMLAFHMCMHCVSTRQYSKVSIYWMSTEVTKR